jgi:hypothetical protein
MILLGVLLLFAACDAQKMLQKFSTPEDQALARSFIDDLRARKLEPIEAAADASIKDDKLHDTLQRMADAIPAGEPDSIKLVGAQTFHQISSKYGASDTVTTTFEYDFGGKWLLMQVMTREANGAKTLIGFHVNSEAAPLEVLNAFTLAGKGAAQYGVLACAIAAVLLSLYALVVCIRTPLRRRKWAWILFIALGFGNFAVNWTTGQWNVKLLAVQLLSASASSQFYGPWIIAFSLPVGAVVFLLRRRQLMLAAAEEAG